MDFKYRKYEDGQLFELMRQGDLDAFTVLFDRYNEPLMDYGFGLTHSKEDAADILQEIFVSLWTRRTKLAFTHSIKAWLYQAVRFQAAKYIHRSVRKRELLEELISLLPEKESILPDSTLQHKQLDVAIKEVIDHMPARMKEVFVLSREQQLSHREIGNRLNIAESTVKKTVQNALRFIREKSILDFVVLIVIVLREKIF